MTNGKIASHGVVASRLGYLGVDNYTIGTLAPLRLALLALFPFAVFEASHGVVASRLGYLGVGHYTVGTLAPLRLALLAASLRRPLPYGKISTKM